MINKHSHNKSTVHYAYTPNQNCSIDESIISYKGHLSFLQYLHKKPHKWRIKAWVMMTNAKRGYINMEF